MARFYGNVGFMKTFEDEGSSWKESKIERPYYGELIRFSLSYESSDKLNDNINVNNEISIIADDFAYSNYHLMKYVYLNGVPWKIRSITVDRPRIVLSIGGVWNGVG